MANLTHREALTLFTDAPKIMNETRVSMLPVQQMGPVEFERLEECLERLQLLHDTFLNAVKGRDMILSTHAIDKAGPYIREVRTLLKIAKVHKRRYRHDIVKENYLRAYTVLRRMLDALIEAEESGCSEALSDLSDDVSMCHVGLTLEMTNDTPGARELFNAVNYLSNHYFDTSGSLPRSPHYFDTSASVPSRRRTVTRYKVTPHGSTVDPESDSGLTDPDAEG